MRRLIWDRKRCVHCGACVGQCSQGAFRVRLDTMETAFEADKCVTCNRCVPACSYGAVKIVADLKGEVSKSR